MSSSARHAFDGEGMTVGEERIEVSLARLEGRMEQVATLLEQRQQRLEKDVYAASSKATKAHERIDSEVDALRAELRKDVEAIRDGVAELHRWRERMIGMAVGVSVGSGVLSGGVVAAIVQLSGA